MSYHLVQYLKRTAGGWISPPEMEACWAKQGTLQCRFDNAAGVALIKCRCADCPGHGTEINAKSDIKPWLQSIDRLKGPLKTDGSQDTMTVEDEEYYLKAIAREHN